MHVLKNQKRSDAIPISVSLDTTAQVDALARVDHVGAGRDLHDAARARERVDRGLDGGRVVMHAVADGAVVLHVADGGAAGAGRRSGQRQRRQRHATDEQRDRDQGGVLDEGATRDGGVQHDAVASRTFGSPVLPGARANVEDT